MAGLRLFTGNRLEVLADKLASRLSVPLSDPLAGEVIVVQSRGMERWLSMEIARRLGVCANVRFPFPKAFVREVFASLLDDMPSDDAYTPEVMTWRIMRILPAFLHQPGFDRIRRYLEEKNPSERSSHGTAEKGCPPETEERAVPDAGDLLRRFQLSERVAYLFDQYLIFRPAMMTAWEKGKAGERDEFWQSELWRALVAESGGNHPAALKEELIRRANRPRTGTSLLPERLSIFGISFLPPFYLDIFHALAGFMEIDMFFMNPSREFWGCIRSDRELDRQVERAREAGKEYDPSREDLYLERGNSLLSSLGAAGREFFSLILDTAGSEADFFTDPGEEDLLSCLQSDILNLRDRRAEGKKITSPQDRSIQFHSCHSPMRELETLHDNLLSLFEEDKGLLPGDILVMAPDIEVYAPLIRAVFDMPEGASGSRRSQIPFSIADRGGRAENAAIDGFMMILDMAGGRFGAGEALSLLEIPEVGAKFGLNRSDCELAGRWVAEVGIRWGRDGEDRRRLGLPPLEENTWREGLNRLLAGYAMPGREGKLINGILPYDLEGSETETLGRFLEYGDKLFFFLNSLVQKRTAAEWPPFLEGLLDGMFAPQEGDATGIQAAREALRQLKHLAEVSGFNELTDISVIKACLNRMFAEKGFGYGFLTGGVTFCSMLPMRSIPFKVICLLGMNGDAYPRKSWAPGFDLMAVRPQPGDRSRRKDDRYLFLEALLSAREKLIISYVGQSCEDNSVMPPSVLVNELIDGLNEGFALPEGGGVAERLVTSHRLQAFSPAYFRGKDGLFSYSEENWRAAQCLVGKKEPSPAAVFRLAAPDAEWRKVEIADLASFFADPVRFLFRKRLDVAFEALPAFPEEREPFSLGGLERYSLIQDMAEKGLAGEDMQAYLKVARASGRMPHGAVGAYYYKSLLKEVQSFIERVEPFHGGVPEMPVDVAFDAAGFSVRGKIPLQGGLLVNYRCADLKAKDHLKLWIFHLALNAYLKDKASPARGVLVGRNESWTYDPPEDAEETFAALLDMYWEGLSRPLKFFPRSSWKYGEDVFEKGKTGEEGLRAAAILWRGSEFNDGESANPYYRACFGDSEPLDEEFCSTAEAILARLFSCRKEIKQ